MRGKGKVASGESQEEDSEAAGLQGWDSAWHLPASQPGSQPPACAALCVWPGKGREAADQLPAPAAMPASLLRQ